MPLSQPSVRRSRAHTRRVEVQGFLREDGLFDLDARLTDLKEGDYLLASGVRKAGDPVHDLFVRVTIDTQFVIVDVEACSEWVPYPGGCDTIAPAYRQLIGLNLTRGFRKTVSDMLGDVRGCSHLTELLLALPTAAIQTYATFRRDTDDGGDSGEKPFQLDRCHALETSSPTVMRYYPRWYRESDPE